MSAEPQQPTSLKTKLSQALYLLKQNVLEQFLATEFEQSAREAHAAELGQAVGVGQGVEGEAHGLVQDTNIPLPQEAQHAASENQTSRSAHSEQAEPPSAHSEKPEAPSAHSEQAEAPSAHSEQPAQPAQPAQPSVARSTALMAIATLGSRATGLIRIWVMAFALGNTLIHSAYQVANNMPNMIFELVAGGLLNAAFVPLYLLQAQKFGKEGGDRFASNLLNIVIVVMGALSLLATIFADQIIATQTFTLDSAAEVNGYAVMFFRIFAIQMLFYGLGGVFTSILNANRVFFLPSIAPLFNNVVVIAAFLVYPLVFVNSPELALLILAIGTTLGVVAQFAVQIPALIKLGFKYVPRIDFRDPAFIETLKTGVPMIIFVTGALLSFTFRNAFSLKTGDEGPSTLMFAWVWFQLPHGIIAASLSRALFTEMSHAVARKDALGFKRFLRQGISGTLFLVIPLAGLMCVLSVPIMQIFRAGAFSADDVAYVGSILALWVFALPFYSLQLYLFNVFASIRRFWMFAIICTALCALQCGLYALLCSNPHIALAGVPISDFVFYLISTAVLLLVLRRLLGPISLRASATTALRVLVATLIGVGLVALALHFLPFGTGIVSALLAVAVYGTLGLAVIFGLCWLMRVPEMSIVSGILNRVTNRLKPSKS
ncbi:MAG: murein biosynthesis integral membrane protein MurJ [Coriobacteriales bacterium]|jgi:putative peptidoglycan lipid II flippase|nr:murein biosynthesis integral membrane protein MurJ [Coriobacteriales bacterium]